MAGAGGDLPSLKYRKRDVGTPVPKGVNPTKEMKHAWNCAE